MTQQGYSTSSVLSKKTLSPTLNSDLAQSFVGFETINDMVRNESMHSHK